MNIDISSLEQLAKVTNCIAGYLNTCTSSQLIFLQGDLGAGKTTFVQYLLKDLGVAVHIPSPSYALLNTYDLEKGTAVHADFYRLESEEDLDLIGWDVAIENADIILVEWPEKALSQDPDIALVFDIDEEKRTLTLPHHSTLNHLIDQLKQL